MMGDARKMTGEQIAFYKKWNAYFKSCEAKYQYTQYHQTYDVFDRATDKNWDGCYRINTEKQAGLLFFYRNNSNDSARNFLLFRSCNRKAGTGYIRLRKIRPLLSLPVRS